MNVPVSRADVVRARTTLGDSLRKTPLIPAPELSELLGVPVLLKAELLQVTGAFKVRGVLNRLAALSEEERSRGVITVSAGNHALALAYGARRLGIDALVVMWPGSSAMKREAVAALGTVVDLEAADPVVAHDRLTELASSTGRIVIHPFDDPLIIAGQGTVGLEILEDCPDTTVILVPTGGGGLVSGIAVAVSDSAVRVVAVEPENSAALHEALVAGQIIKIVPRTVADGLASPFAGKNTYAISRALGVESILVSEPALAEGMRFVYRAAKLAAEPSGAAAVAAVLARKLLVSPGDTVVLVVSGGNVDPRTALRLIADSPEPRRSESGRRDHDSAEGRAIGDSEVQARSALKRPAS